MTALHRCGSSADGRAPTSPGRVILAIAGQMARAGHAHA
jgi:hypothetical protein